MYCLIYIFFRFYCWRFNIQKNIFSEFCPILKKFVGLGLPWKIQHWPFWPNFFPGFPTCVGTPKKNLDQKPNVKFFRVYTYLWGTFNLGFAKMTKFDTFGHISPYRWGRRGKQLIKPEYIFGQGPTKKLINLQTRVQWN